MCLPIQTHSLLQTPSLLDRRPSTRGCLRTFIIIVLLGVSFHLLLPFSLLFHLSLLQLPGDGLVEHIQTWIQKNEWGNKHRNAVTVMGVDTLCFSYDQHTENARVCILKCYKHNHNEVMWLLWAWLNRSRTADRPVCEWLSPHLFPPVSSVVQPAGPVVLESPEPFHCRWVPWQDRGKENTRVYTLRVLTSATVALTSCEMMVFLEDWLQCLVKWVTQ